jgi:hypothetical protein
VRVLEALKILEDAVLECKRRPIDNPELHAALDAVEPYVSPPWSVQNFRLNVTSSGGDLWSHEGQQQNLRVNFGGIYRAIRALLQAQIGKLGAKYAGAKDETVKAELDRLTAELAKLPERWEFYVRKN